METIQALYNEINRLTNHLKTEYPELYRYLDENPMCLPNPDTPTITEEVLKAYLDSLQQVLAHYVETVEHGAPKTD